jgi:hypothetical protein
MIRLLFIILILIPTTAHAYLDPGTGNIIINVLIGGLAAFLYSLKGLFYRIIKGRKNTNQVPKTYREIVIFNEGKQYWGTFKPVINSLISKKRYFSYYTLDIEDPALSIESEYMQSRFLGYGWWARFRFLRLEGSIMLSTTPNIGTPGYPLKRPSKIKKLIHVFHSINDISAYRKGSLDNYDVVIMPGDFQAKSIREIEKVRSLRTKELIALGVPYLDDLVSCKKDTVYDKNAKTVLIGSSWGTKGCLQSYGSSFIRYIAVAGFNVIIRPHPQSVKTEQPLLAKIKSELDGIRNVIWDETISPAESMNRADILISDTSSIRFDFAFIYEKPVITLDIRADEMPGYERDDMKEIWTDTSSHEIGYVIERNEIHDLVPAIKRALENFDTSTLRAIRERTIANYGKSGEAIAEYLCKSESVK